MAEILPFRAVLYDPAKVGDVASVVAPPYDVIGPAEQAALYARHPANVIRLELGQEQPSDGPQDSRYIRARRFLEEWLRAGTLRRDDRPAIYLYAVEYRLRSGLVRTMRGFLSLVRLEEFGTGRIFPHENTRTAAKDDRYRLLETCRSNFSPIFSLYSDAEGRIIPALEEASGNAPPRFAVTDGDGVRHRLWTVTDQSALDRVVTAMKPLPLFIADGHHRYESALRYRNAQRKALGDAGPLPSDWVLMYFSNLDDPGLTILPTHRVLPAPLPCPVPEFHKRLAETFMLEAIPFTKETEPAARAKFLDRLHAAQSSNARVMGLVIREEPRYEVLTLTAAGLGKLGPSARERLDVSILQQVVFRDAMLMTPQDEERLIYIKDEEEVLAAVARGEGELAILLNPPKIAEVKDVARAGDRMPHKSTYFYPKPLTGLVINKMD
ncbi:MAG TPA: DUF1015 domain-containing protein [Nitrospirales bacterium]|nr:DUF1015 domain-containing protein [Nitrospirales bacterium]